jgi:transcriptional regulator with XRE-family HTH domain
LITICIFVTLITCRQTKNDFSYSLNLTFESMNKSNVVTQRFAKCVKRLRENETIKSSRQFAQEVNCLPQTLSEILNGRRDATIEVIRRAVERHHFNPVFLFTGEGELFMTPKTAEATVEAPEIELVSVPETPDDAHRVMLSEIKNLQNMMTDLRETVGQLVQKT